MHIVISPAKKLTEGLALDTLAYTQPVLLKQSKQLINNLQEKDSFEIAQLMKLSVKLADLNTARFQQWTTPFTASNAKQAIFTFAGDVYQGLDAPTLSPEDLAFAQDYLHILSGLYGLLRPFDLMQPYRLEMGTRLASEVGANLYEFWGDTITKLLNQSFEDGDTLINLASNEYFKAIDKKMLRASIITPAFKENKNGSYKMIGFFAKKARGLMTRYIIQNRLTDVEDIKAFNVDGYAFNKSLSDSKTWVFTRG